MALGLKDLATQEVGANSANIPALTNAPLNAWIYIICFATVRLRASTTTFTGFTLFHEEVDENISSGAAILVYRKQSSGSESGTYSISTTDTGFREIARYWVEDVDPDGDTHLVAGNNSGAEAADSFDCPGVTTTVPNTLIISAAVRRGETGGDLTIGSAVELFNLSSERVIAGSDVQVTPGASGAITASNATAAGDKRWAAVSIGYPPIITAVPDPAVISRETVDLALGLQTDTEAHISIDSVDETEGTTHELYGHTSDLGTDPDDWETSGTLIDSSVVADDIVEDDELTPNTTKHYRVVSTDEAEGKQVSNALSITTAYARPTSVTVESKTANTITISATDASEGAAYHQAFRKLASEGAEDWIPIGVVPPNTDLEFTFVDLVEDTEYSLGFASWDGVAYPNGRLSAIVSVNETAFEGDPEPPDENTQPNTPTIFAGTPGITVCPLTSSAFSDPDDGQTHEAAQWQVTLASDTSFEDPVFDSEEDTVNLTSITATGLTTEVSYIARKRDKDDSGDAETEWSDWSEVDSFTTAAEEEPGDPDEDVLLTALSAVTNLTRID